MVEKVKVGAKEYDLEPKDAALIEVLQELTRAIRGLAENG